jgi:exodeoxyribonuclease VII small subunit
MSEGKKRKASERTPSFEEALARLEAIVEELESKELSLEETLARYEEGSKLVAECTKRLEDAERKIQTIGGVPGEQGTNGQGAEDEEDQEEQDGGEESEGDLPF